jgi:hypothetical protein
MTHPRGRALSLLLLAALAGGATGCAAFGRYFGAQDPFGPRAACALAADAGTEEIVAHLNANAARVRSWRATNATIRARGSPLKVNAQIAVEAPRNFRLVVIPPIGGPEVDLGSNEDRFWFWTRRDAEQAIYLACHDAQPSSDARFAIPFQPDWVMEALGVVEFDAAAIEFDQPEGSRMIRLAQRRTTPEGQRVTKVTMVDRCHGLVREHALYDARGQLIARAQLSGHVRDRASQAVLPSAIDFEWPRAQMAMTISLGAIEVNPRAFSSRTFTVPHYTGYRVQWLSDAPEDDLD